MTTPDLYDTTLRDGTQGRGLSLTVADKLAVARRLDDFGVGFIEGGWPGAIPRDTDFFRRAAHELVLRNAVVAAFGATRRPDARAARDPQVTALLAAEAPVVTIVAKSDSRHVERALRTTRAENLAMVEDTVGHLVRAGRRVFVDAEHFFDGFRADPAHALDVVRAATGAGASAVILCDTNGGSLPDEIRWAVTETAARTGARLGIHCHDDSGCAVANTLAALDAGAVQAQVTAHGYGERCGNANLFSVAANLAIKRGVAVVSDEQLAQMSAVARDIAAITGVPAAEAAPYVGASAFTHKAGLHASALLVDPALYQHAEPEAVGNTMRTLVSDMAGRASIELKAAELGYRLPARSPALRRVAERVKEGERVGLSYESADASFELLLRDELAQHPAEPPFRVDTWEVTTSSGPSGRTRTAAVVDVAAGPGRRTATGTGDCPVAALDDALRQGLEPLFPRLARRELVGCTQRALQADDGSPLTRVVITHGDGAGRWSTVGVHADPVAAGWSALLDAFRHALLEPLTAPAEPALRLETAMHAAEVLPGTGGRR
jgi:2-isopropylmalate synthase